jgi:hypothetical protein
MPLSLLCDEHVRFDLIYGLRIQGIGVVSVQDLDLRGRPDPEILAAARQSGRIVYTSDTDFVRLSDSGMAHLGVLFHHSRKYSPGAAINVVSLACQVLSPEEMVNRVEFL